MHSLTKHWRGRNARGVCVDNKKHVFLGSISHKHDKHQSESLKNNCRGSVPEACCYVLRIMQHSLKVQEVILNAGEYIDPNSPGGNYYCRKLNYTDTRGRSHYQENGRVHKEDFILVVTEAKPTFDGDFFEPTSKIEPFNSSFFISIICIILKMEYFFRTNAWINKKVFIDENIIK